MEPLYIGNVEAFPAYDSVYVQFSSMDDNDENSYEMNLPRNEKQLASFFRKLKIQSDPNTLLTMYTQFAKTILNKSVGSFYVPKKNLVSVVDHYRNNAPDPAKLPDFKNKGDPINFFVTESIVLKEDILLNNAIVKKGTRIKFFHEGYINE